MDTRESLDAAHSAAQELGYHAWWTLELAHGRSRLIDDAAAWALCRGVATIWRELPAKRQLIEPTEPTFLGAAAVDVGDYCGSTAHKIAWIVAEKVSQAARNGWIEAACEIEAARDGDDGLTKKAMSPDLPIDDLAGVLVHGCEHIRQRLRELPTFNWEALAEKLGHESERAQLVTPKPTAAYVFRQRGERWEIRFGEESAMPRSRAGFDEIRRILAWKADQTSEEALTLEDPAANPNAVQRGIAQIDVESLNGMIEALQRQRESCTTAAEEDGIDEKIGQLQSELDRCTNIRGKARLSGDERSRAVSRVHKAITRPNGALDYLASEGCPQLADYLRGIGRSGTEITFSPSVRYDWSL